MWGEKSDSMWRRKDEKSLTWKFRSFEKVRCGSVEPQGVRVISKSWGAQVESQAHLFISWGK